MSARLSSLSFPASRFVSETTIARWARKVSPATLAIASRAALGRSACADIAAELSRALDMATPVDSDIAAAHAIAFEAAHGADEE